jgi:transcriptional regulator with XRE-family HTH domain
MLNHNNTTESASHNAKRVADLDTGIRHRIKFLRSREGKTQAEVAQALGIVAQQYHKYESGILRISSGMLVQIADILNCSISELIPESMPRDRSIDPAVRLDALRQELVDIVLDTRSEDVLIAVKTLLSRS